MMGVDSEALDRAAVLAWGAYSQPGEDEPEAVEIAAMRAALVASGLPEQVQHAERALADARSSTVNGEAGMTRGTRRALTNQAIGFAVAYLTMLGLPVLAGWVAERRWGRASG